MAILQPGTFKVSDYRKPIPDAVKVAVVQRTIRIHFEGTGELHPIAYVPAKTIRYDHRPALNTRPYDTEAGDFIPPQNDPQYIEPLPPKDHDYRTFGRKPDAEKVVTTRGSDVGEAAHIRKSQRREAEHKAAIAAKGTPPPADPRRAKFEFMKATKIENVGEDMMAFPKNRSRSLTAKKKGKFR